jgi:hypothetical protein
MVVRSMYEFDELRVNKLHACDYIGVIYAINLLNVWVRILKIFIAENNEPSVTRQDTEEAIRASSKTIRSSCSGSLQVGEPRPSSLHRASSSLTPTKDQDAGSKTGNTEEDSDDIDQGVEKDL